MGFKVNEHLLSMAAREYLDNSKSKAKAARIAIEFYVNYRTDNENGRLIEVINRKLDCLIKSVPSDKTTSNTEIPVVNDDNLYIREKTVEEPITVDIQKMPPTIENDNNSLKDEISLIDENKEDEEELIRLALSSIENIVGLQN